MQLDVVCVGTRAHGREDADLADEDEELAERAEARIGQTLCREYRIERVLGVGRMAFVCVGAHRDGRFPIKAPRGPIGARRLMKATAQ